MIQKLRNQIAQYVHLTDDEWEMLVPFLEIKIIKKNQLFAEIGKLSTEIGFVIEGSFRHYYIKDGEEKTTYFYFENHFVSAYISCITNQPSKLAIEALTDSTLIVFPYSIMNELFEKSLSWQKFGRLIAEYLAIGLEDRMVGLLTLSPEERYLELITGNKSKIIERIPQHLIANYLGITPVSLSRIRKRILSQ